jgi:hypothetical protein
LTIGVHTGDNQVLSCALDITEVTGHTLARENTARILTVTDRTISTSSALFLKQPKKM